MFDWMVKKLKKFSGSTPNVRRLNWYWVATAATMTRPRTCR